MNENVKRNNPNTSAKQTPADGREGQTRYLQPDSSGAQAGSRCGAAGTAGQASAPVRRYDGPDISVIVPVYNLENEVERCLKSILAQKIDRMEIIVVNDCSKDRTEQIVRELAAAHKEIKLISFPENRGVAAARNAALEAATGEFIHFCDGDDAVTPGAYKELLDVARSGNEDLVTGNYSRMYPDEGNAIRQFSHYRARTGRARCFESGNTMLWNKLYRRSVIESNHLRFNEKLKYYEDFLFFCQMLLASESVGYTDDSVYIYTEPLFRDFQSSIRYANIACAEGLDAAWRTLAKQIDAQDDAERDNAGQGSGDGESGGDKWLWAYRWNLDWYFTYSWKMIQDPDIRRRAFDIMRKLVVMLSDETAFGRWSGEKGESEFCRLFRIDYASFCTIDYEDYLLRLAFDENIQPRRADPLPGAKGRTAREADLFREESAEKLLSDLNRVYGMPLSKVKVWRENYWNVLDSILNDCWRPIADREIKERLYIRLQQTVGKFYEENPLCAIPNPDVLRRFKQIFCMDHATFQTLTFSQYMTVGAEKPFAVLPNGGASPAQVTRENIYVQSDPSLVFLTACRNGQVGMRTILRAVREWMSFKKRRRKK